MAGQIDVLDVETHVLRRVAEEVVLADVVRLEDGVEGREDGEAGVDRRQRGVEVTGAAGQLDQVLTLGINTRAHIHIAHSLVVLSLMTADLAC